MTTDPAVTAAAEALSIIGGVPDIWDLRAAGIAVAAARPIILGLDRAAIAAALDAVEYDVPVPDGYIDIDYRAGFDAGIRYALTIVGGDSE